MPDSSRRPYLDRFRALEAEGGAPLDENAPLPVEAADELPFRRCAACGMDAHRSARTCDMCGGDLRTREQERFNHELQHKRREQEAELAREAEALARRQAKAVARQRGYRTAAIATLSRPANAPPPGFDPADPGEVLVASEARRAAGRIASGMALRAIRAVPAVVWLGLAGLLLSSVGYAKTHGGFGTRQLVLTGALLVPVVIGIIVGRPLRRTGRAKGVPPGASPS